MSGLQLVKSDTARVSALPVAGCKFPAVFWGKVALEVGWPRRWPAVPSWLVQLACAAPGVTLVESSEKGAPVRELIWHSVLGEP